MRTQAKNHSKGSDNEAATNLIHLLAQSDAIRVWSLLITILGDMASEKGQEVSGPWLTQMLQPLNISPAAFRVAIHRLKKDEWIHARKEGRISYYSLSEKARKETHAVWNTVYFTKPESTPGWFLGITQNSQTAIALTKKISNIAGDSSIDSKSKPLVTNAPTAIKLNASVYALNNPDAMDLHHVLVLPLNDASVPSWLDHSEPVAALVSLANAVLHAHDSMNLDVSKISRVEALAIRFLTLHFWRKLALKEASWFHMRHCPEGAISRCQRRVNEVLTTTAWAR